MKRKITHELNGPSIHDVTRPLPIPQHERFAQMVADGVLKWQAAKKCYPTNKAPRSCAAQLMAKNHIKGRVYHLMDVQAKKFEVSREDLLAKLMNIVDDDDARNADRINAIKQMSRMCGFDAPRKVDHDVGFKDLMDMISGKAAPKQIEEKDTSPILDISAQLSEDEDVTSNKVIPYMKVDNSVSDDNNTVE